MVCKIIISRLAEQEIDEAFEYYESKKRGLGKQFLLCFNKNKKILQINPELFAIKKEPFFRELPLQQFPFVIIYEIIMNEVIIYSVFHTHRNPTNKP